MEAFALEICRFTEEDIIQTSGFALVAGNQYTLSGFDDTEPQNSKIGSWAFFKDGSVQYPEGMTGNTTLTGVEQNNTKDKGKILTPKIGSAIDKDRTGKQVSSSLWSGTYTWDGENLVSQ